MFSLFDNNIPGTNQQLIGTGGSIPPPPPPAPSAPSSSFSPSSAKPQATGAYDKDRAFLKKLKDMGYDANQAFQALQDVKAGKQPSIGQPAQAQPETPAPEETGFMADVKRSIRERAKNADEIASVDQTGAERFIQEAGQGAGFLTDVAFAGIKAGAKALTPEPVKTGIVTTGKAAAEALPDFIKNAGIAAAKSGIEAYDSWRTAHPRAALNLEATVNIASILPAGKVGTLAKEWAGAAVGQTGKAIGSATTGIRKEIAQSLKKSAAGDIAQALAPTKKEMKIITEKITPEFLNKGIVGSRESILKKATTGMEDYGKQIENYLDTGKLVGEVPRSSIDKAIDSFAAGAKSKAGIVIDDEKLLLADRMRSLTAKFGESLPADEAKSVLRVLGEMTARKKGFTTGAEKLSAELERNVYGTIARELAKANPELDKLNKAFSFYKNLANVTEETISRVAPQSGGLRKAASMLFAGDGTGGVLDNAIRYVGSRVFLDFVSSPFYSTVKSRIKTALADAIYSGNTKVADDIIRTATAWKTVTPVMLKAAKEAPKSKIAAPMSEIPVPEAQKTPFQAAVTQPAPANISKFASESKWTSENGTSLSPDLVSAMDRHGISTAPVKTKAALRTMPGIKDAEKAISANPDYKSAYDGFKTASEKADFARLVNYAKENESRILEEYRKGYWNVVNTDEFRTFLGGQRGVMASTNHEIASGLAKKYLAQLLEENKGQGKKFIILAGGGGSGKGATQKAFALSNPDAVILDGTFANMNSGLKNLRMAESMGFKPEVAFTMRNFEWAIDGIAERAVNMGKKGLLPRTVPFSEASKAHALARKNVLETYDNAIKDFADGKVSFWDNTGKMEDFKQIDRAQVAKLIESNPIPSEIPDWYVSKINDLVKSGKLSKALGKNLMSAAAFATVVWAMMQTWEAPKNGV